MNIPKNIIICGNPGTGKTTLIKEALMPFKKKVSGFMTEEIRGAEGREGFRMISMDGRHGILASKMLNSCLKLGKYRIDAAVIENIAVVSMLEGLEKRDLIIIDEIGAMETVSEKFTETAVKCLLSANPVLATARLGSKPFEKEFRNMENTEVLTLDRSVYPSVSKKVKEWLAHWSDKLADKNNP